MPRTCETCRMGRRLVAPLCALDMSREGRVDARSPGWRARLTRSGVTAYAAAAALALAAEFVRQTLRSMPAVEHPSVFLFLHFPAVLAAALWLGLGPGIACATVSTLLVAWWMPPDGSVRVVDARDLQALALFAGSAALVCAF